MSYHFLLPSIFCNGFKLNKDNFKPKKTLVRKLLTGQVPPAAELSLPLCFVVCFSETTFWCSGRYFSKMFISFYFHLIFQSTCVDAGKKAQRILLFPNRRLRNHFLLSLWEEKPMFPSLNWKLGRWGLLPQHKLRSASVLEFCGLNCQRHQRADGLAHCFVPCSCRGFLHKQRCGWTQPGGWRSTRGVWGQTLFPPLTPVPDVGCLGSRCLFPRAGWASVLLTAWLFCRSQSSHSSLTAPPSKITSVSSSTTFALYSL